MRQHGQESLKAFHSLSRHLIDSHITCSGPTPQQGVNLRCCESNQQPTDDATGSRLPAHVSAAVRVAAQSRESGQAGAMKKASARPGQLVRSASRRNKTPARFQFDVSLDRLFGTVVRPGNTYYVKWSRGVKVAQSKPVKAGAEHGGGNKSGGGLPLGAEKLSLLVTLYRTDEGGTGSIAKFDEKDSKLSVISVNSKGQERTVAKMHFDLAAYAGVPSATATKIFKLSEKASLRAIVDSRFTKSGPAGPKSALSAMTGASGQSSEDDDEDDFGDLDLDDVPEPEPVRRPPVSRLSSGPNSSGSAGLGSNAARRRSGGGSGGGLAASPALAAPALAAVAAPSAPIASSAGFIARSSKTHASGSGPSDTMYAAASVGLAAVGSTSTFGRASSGRESGSSAPSPPVSDSRPNPSITRAGGGSGSGSVQASAEIAALKDENEKLTIDLRRSQDKRKRMESAHETEKQHLHDKLIAANSQVSNTSNASSAKANALAVDLAATTAESDRLRSEVEALRSASRDAEKLRVQNKELSRDVDRLTVAAASSGDGGGGGGADSREVQDRLDKLQSEKETVENKLKAHQSHSAKVKETYGKLTGMYNQLREENIALQGKIEAADDRCKVLEASSAASGGSADSGASAAKIEALEVQVREAKQAARDAEASKASTRRDCERLEGQVQSMQGKLDKAIAELGLAREEADYLHAQIAELTSQRDTALARAKGSATANRGADEARYAEAVRVKEQAERELARLKLRTDELEREVGEVTEDLEYEKAEKLKAREERDALRESARALERRTSQVSQTADAVHSLKRELSTVKMRDADQTAMITDLREELERVQSETREAVDKARRAGASSGASSGAGAADAVLEDLVNAKLALALAEDERLQLQLALKNLKRNEKAVQDRLATHASSLEVKLAKATDELQQARSRLDSDVSF
jgi:N-terminal C2 in EEIG1 and EHBP1 proteins